MSQDATQQTKKMLSAIVAEKTGLTQKKGLEVVNAVFEAIAKNVKAGNSTIIAGFGKFYVKTRAARDGRNPRTGAALHTPAKQVAGAHLTFDIPA